MKLSAIKPVSRALARELAVTALLLLGVSVVVFAILYLAPGDPLNVLLDGQSPRSELARGTSAISSWVAGCASPRRGFYSVCSVRLA